MAMDFKLDDIKKLSPQVKALIVVVVIFVIGYLYYFYFLSDTLTKRSELIKQNEELQAQIQQKEKIVAASISTRPTSRRWKKIIKKRC